MKKMIPAIIGLLGLAVLGFFLAKKVLPETQKDKPVEITQVENRNNESKEIAQSEMADSSIMVHGLDTGELALGIDLPNETVTGTYFLVEESDQTEADVLATAEKIGIVNPQMWTRGDYYEYHREEVEIVSAMATEHQSWDVRGDDPSIQLNYYSGGQYNLQYTNVSHGELYEYGPPNYDNFPPSESLIASAEATLLDMGLLPEQYNIRLGQWDPSVVFTPIVNGQELYNAYQVETTVSFVESGEISNIRWPIYTLIEQGDTEELSAEEAYDLLISGTGQDLGPASTYETAYQDIMDEMELGMPEMFFHNSGSNSAYEVGQEVELTGHMGGYLENTTTNERLGQLYLTGPSSTEFDLKGDAINTYSVDQNEEPMVTVTGLVSAVTAHKVTIDVTELVKATPEDNYYSSVCLSGEITAVGDPTIFHSNANQAPYLSMELKMKREVFSDQDYILPNPDDRMTVGLTLELCGVTDPVAGQEITWTDGYVQQEPYEYSEEEYEYMEEYDPENPREEMPEELYPPYMDEYVIPFENGEEVNIEVLVEAYVYESPDETEYNVELIHFDFEDAETQPYMEPTIFQLVDENGDPASEELLAEIAAYGNQYLTVNGRVLIPEDGEGEYYGPYGVQLVVSSYETTELGTPKNYYGSMSITEIEGNETVIFTESNTGEVLAMPMIPTMMFAEAGFDETLILVASKSSTQSVGEYPIGYIHDIIEYGIEDISSADEYPEPEIGPEINSYMDEVIDEIYYPSGTNTIISVEKGYVVVDPYEEFYRANRGMEDESAFLEFEQTAEFNAVPAWIFTVENQSAEYQEGNMRYAVPTTVK